MARLSLRAPTHVSLRATAVTSTFPTSTYWYVLLVTISRYSTLPPSRIIIIIVVVMIITIIITMIIITISNINNNRDLIAWHHVGVQVREKIS